MPHEAGPHRTTAATDAPSEGQHTPPSSSTTASTPRDHGPFERAIATLDRALLSDDILPAGVLLECASVDVLNCYINYVDLAMVLTERDPEEDERYISMSNQFYTHFHEFGTVIHVVASSARHWWYFCYDIDANDCALGRVEQARISLKEMREWVRQHRISGRYPTLEVDIGHLRGWRSFQ
jgi:hypothetical protein